MFFAPHRLGRDYPVPLILTPKKNHGLGMKSRIWGPLEWEWILYHTPPCLQLLFESVACQGTVSCGCSDPLFLSEPVVIEIMW